LSSIKRTNTDPTSGDTAPKIKSTVDNTALRSFINDLDNND